jgi:hypothetical protein
MSAAVLFRTTDIGSIELAVSDRVAALAGVARDTEYDREFRPDPLNEWRERLKRMDESERKKEQRRRTREAPMTDVSPGHALEPDGKERDPVAIDARRKTLETGAARPLPAKNEEGKDDVPYPNAGKFFLVCANDRASRQRGVPGNTAPSSVHANA